MYCEFDANFLFNLNILPIFTIISTFVLFRMRRTQKHVLAFMMSELGTTASLDANSQLIIKGRFQIKQIENVLRNYISAFTHFNFSNCLSDSRLIDFSFFINRIIFNI